MLQEWTKPVGAWLRQCAAALLQAGPVPQHVAFIMDGNRRFADRVQLDRFGGHSRGYDKLVQALEWCLELGVPCVSVYAFSLENFNRSAEEVALLMRLAEQKLLAILQEDYLIERHGVRVQVLGDLGRLPDRVAEAARQCMDATAHQQRCVLNICLAYTSTQEMWQAVAGVREQVAAGQLASADIDADTLQRRLYTKDCPPVDLLIRTSGETRLSDFLLPQSGHAALSFSAALWPDFSFLDMLGALAEYQRQAGTLRRVADAAAAAEGAAGTLRQVSDAAAAGGGAGRGQAAEAAASGGRGGGSGAVEAAAAAVVRSGAAAACGTTGLGAAPGGGVLCFGCGNAEADGKAAASVERRQQQQTASGRSPSAGDPPDAASRREAANGAIAAAVKFGLAAGTTAAVGKACGGQEKQRQYDVLAASGRATAALVSN